MVLTKWMTAEELADLPDDDFQHELVRGVLRSMPLPIPEQGYTIGRVALPLLSYGDEIDHVTVLIGDVGVILERNPDTVRGPDVSVYLSTELPPRPWNAYVTTPPVLAVEVDSFWDEQSDIEEKIADYRKAGVQLIWYIFPETQTVWVDGANRTRVILSVNDVLDASDILPGIALIPISEIFQ